MLPWRFFWIFFRVFSNDDGILGGECGGSSGRGLGWNGMRLIFYRL